jgi:hypothetical protein
MKIFYLSLLMAAALINCAASPSRAGSDSNLPTVPIETPAAGSSVLPAQSAISPLSNNTFNSGILSGSYSTNQSNCSGPVCVQGGLTSTPNAGVGGNIGITWNPSGADLQNTLIRSERHRQHLLMLEARRQISNDLATAIEQKQWDRARILAIQLVSVRNYRDYLMRITGGKFPNP